MDNNKKQKLFSEFPPASTNQWEEKIKEDLKGADYEKKLIWTTIDELKIRPYYRTEDIKDLGQASALPGEFPYVRGKNFEHNNWIIRQDINGNTAEQSNYEAINAIKKGAEAIGFNVLKIAGKEELSTLTKGIDLGKVAVCFTNSNNYKELFYQFSEIVKKRNYDPKSISGSLNYDPLSYYINHGTFYNTEVDNWQETVDLINHGINSLPLYKIININSQHFNETGASIVQEVAFALAQGNEYLAQLTGKGLTVDDIAPRMQFNFYIGSNYFMEIAKLRAFKMLWANVVKQYKPASDKTTQTYIHAITSPRNKTIYDPYVNILRTSTEAMSAAIGGVDSMTVIPFDSTFKNPDDFSKRIARNQQIILKHEAYFNKVADPAAGSYYIEQLTHSIASEAWKIFKKVDSHGGIFKASTNGFIKSEMEKTWQKREANIAKRKRVFVGTNKYPNPQDKMLEKIHLSAKFFDPQGIKQYRGARSFESIRLSVELHNLRGFPIPKVFLFTYGNPAMRKARAGFTTDCFGCAGYDIIDNTGFETIEQGVEAAVRSNAEIVVLCSSDEEYSEMTGAARQIKEKAKNTIIIVAGNPVNQKEKLKEAGVDDFINIKSNLLEVLKKYNTKLLKK